MHLPSTGLSFNPILVWLNLPVFTACPIAKVAFQSYFSLIKSSTVTNTASEVKQTFNPILVWLNRTYDFVKSFKKDNSFNPILVWLNLILFDSVDRRPGTLSILF